MTAAERPEGGEALQHPPSEKSQRKGAALLWPHGYTPYTAACYLQEVFEALDLLSEGRPPGAGPLIEAGKALSRALAEALDTVDCKETET